MRRRSFMATLAAVFTAPKVLEAKPKEKHFFNPKVLNDRVEFLGQLPIRHPLQSEGFMEIGDQQIIIHANSNAARVGDVLTTTTGNKLYVKNVEVNGTPVQVFETFRRTAMLVRNDNKYTYTCTELQAPKRICGVPVIKIHGKYRRYRSGHELIKVSFMPIMSVFKEGEGGVSHG